MTDEGHRAIFGTDLSLPPHENVERIRSELARLRGQLFDIYQGNGWRDQLEIAEHGLTLIISYLHSVAEEMTTPPARGEGWGEMSRLPTGLPDGWPRGPTRDDELEAENRDLRARVRAYAKALRIAQTLTGWATSSDVDRDIKAALRRPLRRAKR